MRGNSLAATALGKRRWRRLEGETAAEESQAPAEADAEDDANDVSEEDTAEGEPPAKKLDLEGLEGLRGDGVAKWYVVHTYSGHENKVKVNIEKIVETGECRI